MATERLDIIGKTLSELRALLVGKQVSAREILDAHVKHAQAVDAEISAFNSWTLELAARQADKADAMVAAGDTLPPLAGIPIVVKDNMCVDGYATTCSSKILENFVPPYNATVIERLLESGALLMAKTNMDEFAMGSSTENSAFRLTRNPWNRKMVPGGSSGGSAASVAAGCSTVALGSDTGGSIRQPASLCGVVGMKPTYGLVSRFGLIAFASSLDQIGPFGRVVKDVATVLQVIGGHDRRDSTSINKELPLFARELQANIKGMRIGVIRELIGEGIQPDVRDAIKAASAILASLGAEVDEVSLPTYVHALPVYYLIATAEASANLARYDGVKYGHRNKEAEDILSMYYRSRQDGFGPEVKRRIMLGTYALSSGYYDAYYKKAQQVRRLIKEDCDRAFEKYDLLACPTSPSVAFEFGEKTDDPLEMYLADIATVPVNLTGTPAISVPCGLDGNGLPIGLQLNGPALSDLRVLTAAYAFEQSTEFHKQLSPMLSARS